VEEENEDEQELVEDDVRQGPKLLEERERQIVGEPKSVVALRAPSLSLLTKASFSSSASGSAEQRERGDRADRCR